MLPPNKIGKSQEMTKTAQIVTVDSILKPLSKSFSSPKEDGHNSLFAKSSYLALG